MGVVSSALGNYEIVGDPSEGDSVMGVSFGTGAVNDLIARQVVDYGVGKPKILDVMVGEHYPEAWRSDGMVEVIETEIVNAAMTKGGMWNVLEIANDYMRDNDLSRLVIVGHACHIGRVAMQAQKLGMNVIVPSGLPRQFDRDSQQFWTRSKGIWVPAELAAAYKLRKRGQL